MIATTASAAAIGQPPTRERTVAGCAGRSPLSRRRTRMASGLSGGGFALDCVGSAFPGDAPGASQREAAPGERGNRTISDRKQEPEQWRYAEIPRRPDLNPDDRRGTEEGKCGADERGSGRRPDGSEDRQQRYQNGRAADDEGGRRG